MEIARNFEKIQQGYKVYIHAPYSLNLSRIENDNWTINSLKKHITIANSFGCLGVVIHCGIKKKEKTEKEAYERMKLAIIEASSSATETCPLLLETSAGETGELLSNPDDLITFYTSLPEETKKTLKLCVDTCHVFSAGYTPMNFITKLEEASLPIKLIHYNDCKGRIGCCKDRHARIGSGFIGLDELNKVGMHSLHNGYDLVYE